MQCALAVYYTISQNAVCLVYYIEYSHFYIQNIIYSALCCLLLILTVISMFRPLHYTIVCVVPMQCTTKSGISVTLGQVYYKNLGHCV